MSPLISLTGRQLVLQLKPERCEVHEGLGRHQTDGSNSAFKRFDGHHGRTKSSDPASVLRRLIGLIIEQQI